MSEPIGPDAEDVGRTVVCPACRVTLDPEQVGWVFIRPKVKTPVCRRCRGWAVFDDSDAEEGQE